jgi:hypothetical protein
MCAKEWHVICWYRCITNGDLLRTETIFARLPGPGLTALLVKKLKTVWFSDIL